MVPADEHLVEENIQSISYEEQIPEHCEMRSLEGVKKELSEEKQAVYKKSKISELQVGQNIEKVRFLFK